MSTRINTIPSVIPPVIANFGWYFGSELTAFQNGEWETPLNTLVTFDAVDSNNLGLGKILLPPGVTIVSYVWKFNNGYIGYGPQAGTTFSYPQSIPGYSVALQLIDSLGRTASVARQINLQALSPMGGGMRNT